MCTADERMALKDSTQKLEPLMRAPKIRRNAEVLLQSKPSRRDARRLSASTRTENPKRARRLVANRRIHRPLQEWPRRVPRMPGLRTRKEFLQQSTRRKQSGWNPPPQPFRRGSEKNLFQSLFRRQ